MSSDCGVWFSTVELVRPDIFQVTRVGLIACTRAKKSHSCPGTLANMTGPIGEVTNLVTLLAGATFGATRLWKVVKKAHTLSPGLALSLAAGPRGSCQEVSPGGAGFRIAGSKGPTWEDAPSVIVMQVLGGLSALQGAVEGLRDRCKNLLSYWIIIFSYIATHISVC